MHEGLEPLKIETKLINERFSSVTVGKVYFNDPFLFFGFLKEEWDYQTDDMKWSHR